MRNKRGKVCFTILICGFLLLIMALMQSYHQDTSFAEEKSTQSKPSADKAWKPDGPLTFICFSPGSAYDRLARQIGSVLPDYLGKRVILQGVPGGGGMNALDVLSRAKPDGRTFAIYSNGTQVILLFEKRYKWDVRDMNVVLAIDTPPHVVLTSKHSGLKSFKDLIESKNVIRIVIAGSNANFLPLLLALDKNNVRYKVSRFTSAAQAGLTVIAGDAEISMSAASSTALVPIREGDLLPLWIWSDKRYPALPDVPTHVELGMPKAWGSYGSKRLIALPPGVPVHIQKALTEALTKAIHDKRTLEWSKKAEIPVDIVTREEYEESIRTIEEGFKQNLEVVKRYYF